MAKNPALDEKWEDNYNIIMRIIQFEWDEIKNRINKRKHKISFEEAETVFYDENAILIPDPDHSEQEERFIILGFSLQARLLIVCHCYRGQDDIIRIISARKANNEEMLQYNGMEEY